MSTAAAFRFAAARPVTTAAKVDRFASQSLETATPGQLLVRLYDRLLLDIARGEAEQRASRHGAASEQLLHAQAIVSELMSNLDVDAWSGAPRLMSIYSFLLTELVNANVQHDPDRTASCRRLVEPLAEAWREAAGSGTTPVTTVAAGRAPVREDGVPAPRTSLVG